MDAGFTQAQAQSALEALVPFMRNANWYYENYFIQLKLANARGVTITKLNTVITDLNTELGAATTKIQKAQDATRTAIIISIVEGVVVAGGITYLVLHK